MDQPDTGQGDGAPAPPASDGLAAAAHTTWRDSSEPAHAPAASPQPPPALVAPGSDTAAGGPAEAGLRQQLADSQARVAALFDHSPWGQLLLEADSLQILEANPAACARFGRTPAQLCGRVVTDVDAAMGMARIGEIGQRLQGDAPVTFQTRIGRPDGRRCEVRVQRVRLPGRCRAPWCRPTGGARWWWTTRPSTAWCRCSCCAPPGW